MTTQFQKDLSYNINHFKVTSKFIKSKIDSDLKKSLNVLTNKQSPVEIKTNSDVVQIIQIYKDGSFLTFSPKS